MRFFRPFSIVLALLAVDEARSAPNEIQIRRTENGFVLTVTLKDVVTLQEAQASLVPKATELCAGGRFQLGTYKFNQSEPVGRSSLLTADATFVLEQNVLCGSANTASPAQPDPAWRPSQQEADTIVKMTERYQSFKDNEKLAEGYSLLSAEMKKFFSVNEWREATTSFNARAGTLIQRAVVKISFSVNPAGATPGIYAAVDFVGKFENLDTYCGYLVWFRQPDGSWLLRREEQSEITHAEARKLGPEALASVKDKFGCGKGNR
jgi:hypothetical protein